MAKFAMWKIAGFAAGLGIAIAGSAAAQTPPPAAAPAMVDAALAAQKSAFEALPEADRKAVQEALVWTGHYVGIVDGSFGKRTRDSIVAWQTSIKARTYGVIDAPQLAALKASLQKDRAAVGFQSFIDARTGVRIGAPLKLLDKRSQSGADSALSKSDGSIVLVLHANSGDAADFAALYAKLSADAPGRKITYKASKPEVFFVVSGEEAGRKFYTRIAKASATSLDPAARRGFTFTYPAAQSAIYDKMTLAIADSFDPFPASLGATVVAPAQTALATPAPNPVAPPPGPALAATGYVVAAGQAITALSAANCAGPLVDGKPVKFVREDKDIGVALIGGDFGAGIAPPSFGDIGPEMVALSFEQDKPGAPSLIVAPASPLPAGEAGLQVLAPLAKSGAGSPVFDRKGGLAALIAQGVGEAKQVNGVAALAAHRAIDTEKLRLFLGASADAPASDGAPLSAGQVAAARRGAVIAIFCRR